MAKQTMSMPGRARKVAPKQIAKRHRASRSKNAKRPQSSQISSGVYRKTRSKQPMMPPQKQKQVADVDLVRTIENALHQNPNLIYSVVNKFQERNSINAPPSPVSCAYSSHR